MSAVTADAIQRRKGAFMLDPYFFAVGFLGLDYSGRGNNYMATSKTRSGQCVESKIIWHDCAHYDGSGDYFSVNNDSTGCESITCVLFNSSGDFSLFIQIAQNKDNLKPLGFRIKANLLFREGISCQP